MTWNNIKKDSTKLTWPGRKAAIRRLLLIAAVLFPCTWIVNAFLVGSWNLLGDRNAESIRHLREAGVIFVGAVTVVFLFSLLPGPERFFNWLCSWRIMRRCLIALAWLVTIVAVFYGVEDWRGRRAWNNYSNTLIAQGEQLDFKAFVPKPVPDAENFAAIPEIQAWFLRGTNSNGSGFNNFWWTDNFAVASTMVSESGKIPPRITDLVAWKMAFDAVQAGKTNAAEIFTSGKLDPESRAQAAPAILEALKPIAARLEEFRKASSRPESRYPVIYDLDNPWGILLPHLAQIKGTCLRLDLRACAELAVGQSDRALEDVKLSLRMGDSLKTEPFLISYLVRVAAIHLAVHSVWEGLAEHRWSDAQLKELQMLLERYNFVADLKFPLDGERAGGILTANLLANGKISLNALTGDSSSMGAPAANAFGRIMPRGWWEKEKLNYCRLYILQMEDVYDGRTKRVLPSKLASNMKAVDDALAGRHPLATICARHQLLSAIMLPALGNVPKKGAAGQVAVDQAVLACALERYRLAHGQFPDRLEALAPDFITTPPRDVITGEPYKYRRTTDNFILYSVGWNEIDDGGKLEMKGSFVDIDMLRGHSMDLTRGDWIWQYPKK
jgi:hypothetical protein